MSLLQDYQYCGCEDPKGTSLCAECERKIELAEKSGLTFTNEWEDQSPQFMGDKAQWSRYQELLNDCEFCTHDNPCKFHYNEQLELNVGKVEPVKGEVY